MEDGCDFTLIVWVHRSVRVYMCASTWGGRC